MLSDIQKEKIKRAYKKGTLTTRSVSPRTGEVEWKPVTAVHRADTAWERIVKITTPDGDMTLTGGHGIYLDPVTKVDADTIQVGQPIQGARGKVVVVATQDMPARQHMYDVTVADNHNLILKDSQALVSNCPDRNYHFRPPTTESTINKYNRVFAYIWEDEELIEYMERAVDFVNLSPPETHWHTIDKMVKAKPPWRQMILMGAISHAAMALAFNWTADEFDYSIGGVSLSIDRSSKYESLKNNAESQFDKMLESKVRTVKIIRGLQQSRYGIGVRSAFGPVTGHGVMVPARYMGF